MQPENHDGKVCGCVSDSDAEICGDGRDNECNGAVDDCQTCGGKAIPKDDPAHCGECDNACRSDQICNLSECKCPLDAPLECAGKCVDPETDAQHCGQCANDCKPGQTCSAGACGCPDTSSPDYCDGAGCVDLDSDAANCGSCGNACETGLLCVDGDCVCNVSGQTHCGASGCVDLESNPYHCGACNEVCAPEATCTAGSCECPPGTPDVCNGHCTNLSSNSSQCGSCGKACGPGQGCVGGTCACPPGAPTACSNGCFELTNDPSNCGACGSSCLSGQICQGGQCTCPGNAPSLCGGVCINANTDPNHCGACFNTCPSGLVCLQGACGCGGLNQKLCGSSCVNHLTDESNCGDCGNVCGASQTCLTGVCKCNTSSLTACGTACVNTNTDVQNCGACGNACPTSYVCSAGSCVCPSGQTFCNAANACVDLKSNASHCGACGNACNPGQICQNSACKCPSSQEAFCASTGACTNVSANDDHCGACDNVCPANTTCQSFACKCDQTGYTLCGSSCYNLQNDASHCGGCSTVCGPTQVCQNGSCVCPAAVVGAEQRLTVTTTSTGSPAMAWNGTHFAVLYFESAIAQATSGDLYLALLNADGTRAQTPDILVATPVALQPDIVWNGSEWGLTWYAAGDVWFQRRAPDGTALAAAIDISAITPGSAQLHDQPRITWSSVYGGYALFAETSGLDLQLIGPTGAAPSPVNSVVVSNGPGRPAFAVAQSGEWAALSSRTSSPYFALFNPDGSKTKPHVVLHPSTSTLPNVFHDGTTWLSVFRDNGDDVRVNRGEVANSPVVVATATTLTQLKALRGGGQSMSILWVDADQLRLQRYNIPTSAPNSNVSAFGGIVPIVSTTTVKHLDAQYAGTGSLLAVWADSRWGAYELYAAPVNFGSCP